MQVKFRILGGLEAEVDGVPVPLAGQRDRTVLATLLLEAGHVVPVSSLVAALWADDPPVTATKQVRNAVSRLRGLLAGAERPGAIVAEGDGYRLAVRPDSIDARVFEAQVNRAAEAAAAGRRRDAARILADALGLWRGPFLAGVPGRLAETAAAAWAERRLAAEEAYHEHMLALGQHDEIIARLSEAVAAHPMREKSAGQLMLALYRSGRQADALRVYRETRDTLAEELGLDPGQPLQQLHQQILTSDPGIAAPVEAAGQPAGAQPAHPAPAGVPRQLPAATRHFAGRADAIKALDILADEVAGPPGVSVPPRGTAASTVLISAIDGTAGIGKTALAVHWAHRAAVRFPDGQLYLNLRGFDPAGTPVSAGTALGRLLGALGVPAHQLSADLDGQAALLRGLLAGKRMLILLDNARDAAQVRPLLPGAPGCLVVVTSRSQLTSLVAVEGAHPLTLGLLTMAEADELLARRLGPEAADRDAAAVSQIIGLCARLPLALSVAAARAASQPGVSLAAVAAELRDARDRLDPLTAGDAVSDVRAVFSWSYERLSPSGRRLFRLLGLHPGPDISAAAVASLAGLPEDQAPVMLAELTRANLLTEPLPARYVLHDLLRAYAAELAGSYQDGAERDAATLRMLDHYLHSALAADRRLNPARDLLALAPHEPGVRPEEPASEGAALAWMRAEHQVLLAVTAAAARLRHDTHGWQIPWTLDTYFQRQGHWHDHASVQRVSLMASQRLGDVRGQAHAHRGISRALAQLGSYQEARVHAEQAARFSRQAGDLIGQARAELDAGEAFERERRYADALRHAERALALFRAAGLRSGEANALNCVGWCHTQLGDYEQAIACCEQSLNLHRQSGDSYGEAGTWDSIGCAQQQLGQHDAAVDCFVQALSLLRELGDRGNEAEVLSHLGDSQQALGDHPAAQASWVAALRIREELRHPEVAELRAKLAQSRPA
jgi:DNA-binding SARP family transcriptional activator